MNGVTTRYVYLGSDLALEADASWNLLARYFYEPGVDHPVSRTDSSGTYYYLEDLSGNVAALTSSTGTLRGTYQYNPWGQVVSSTPGLPTQPLLWAVGSWTKPGCTTSAAGSAPQIPRNPRRAWVN